MQKYIKESPEEISWYFKKYWIFWMVQSVVLTEDEIWYVDTMCMILDPNDVEGDDDEAPKIALENGVSYALDVQTIQSIVQNISEQKRIYTDEELLEAFLYYYDNDAYIEQTVFDFRDTGELFMVRWNIETKNVEKREKGM